MSAVSEWIVREYFEELGFLVRQPRKYMVSARAKRADEEIDLVVFSPSVSELQLPEKTLWSTADLQHVQKAIVGVRGWHTERFSPAVLEESPEVCRFAEEDMEEHVSEALGEGPVAKILCLPGLPASPELRERSLAILKANGIHGVLLFRTMLLELMTRVEVNKSYDKSDLLQILRILKNYDLLRDAQLELFGRRGRR